MTVAISELRNLMNIGCQPGVSLKFTMHDRIEKRRKLNYSLDFTVFGLIVFYFYIFGFFLKYVLMKNFG